MGPEALGKIVEPAACDVFSTMLSLDLAAGAATENRSPLEPSEVTAMIGIAGDQQGFVALHSTHAQAQAFTARLLGMEPEEVTDSDSILDAMGEIVNMVAGNVKRELASCGEISISLPTVVISEKPNIRVRASESVVVYLDGPCGEFCVELVLQEGASTPER